MNFTPLVSVIIPVFNSGPFLGKCLQAVKDSIYAPVEIIVVDDCSTQEVTRIIKQEGITVYRLPRRLGPAAARNYGASRAKGNYLVFLDSDVVIRKDTIQKIIKDFQAQPGISAVFGSYDDEPAEENFISQYRNLLHHYHHQNSNKEAFSFWAGCGTIRREVFEELGGFDQNRYSKPSIEDIELGFRIRKKGYRIILEKELQVKHLKAWSFWSMLRTDIFQRALPWSCLILETKTIPKDLNLQLHHKISSLSVALLLLAVPLLFICQSQDQTSPACVPVLALFLILLGNLLLLNRKLYGFYARKRGTFFMLKAIPLHFFYYFYSGLSFVYCRFRLLFKKYSKS